jgi:hypothetical protein
VLGAQQGELEGHIAELDLATRLKLGLLYLCRVDVDPVQAAFVGDEEMAVLVPDTGVALRDRRLVQEEVVVASPADRVVPWPQEMDLLGDVPAEHLQDRDREVRSALYAAGLVRGIVVLALRAFHSGWMMPEEVRPGQSASHAPALGRP